jgi:transcriptional regulator with XRE-family HTH domain
VAERSTLDLDLEKLGGFIRAQRKIAGFSLRQLSEVANVSSAYLSQLERGRHEPSVRVLLALARSLGVSADSLLTYLGLAADETTAVEQDVLSESVEVAIAADPRLSDEQRRALLSVYRSYVERQ